MERNYQVMEEKLIGLVRVQARKVRKVKGKREPSSYMLTIPKEAVDILNVKNRKDKVRVLLDEEKKQLAYQF